MKRVFLLLISCLVLTWINGQNIQQATSALAEINNFEEFEELKKKYLEWEISTDITMISDSAKFPKIVNSQIGDILTKQYSSKAPLFVMKVVEFEDEELCKAKYIYLDGSTLSKSVIDSVRHLIMQRYNKGEEFEVLVREYTMDGNTDGDLGWFYKGMMVKEFDQAVRPRPQGEIFTIDVEHKNWYYIVLKTHQNKFEKAIKSIRIKCPITN